MLLYLQNLKIIYLYTHKTFFVTSHVKIKENDNKYYN